MPGRPDPTTLTDRELMIWLFNDVGDLKRTVNGNGQPGLVVRVTETAQELRDHKAEAAEDIRQIRASVPSPREKGTFVGSVIMVVAAAIFQAWRAVFA